MVAIGQLKAHSNTVEDLKQMVGTFNRELEEKDATIKQKDETITQHEATIARYEKMLGLGEFQKWYDEIFIREHSVFNIHDRLTKRFTASQTTWVPWRNP
jgi:hypothetical protein